MEAEKYRVVLSHHIQEQLQQLMLGLPLFISSAQLADWAGVTYWHYFVGELWPDFWGGRKEVQGLVPFS